MKSRNPHEIKGNIELLYRDRLVSQINVLILKQNLIFISAPGGYGKTVAATQSLGKRLGTPGWFSLAAEDNQPAVFYARFGQAVSLARGTRNGGSLSRMLECYTLDALLSALSSLPPCRHKACLLLDDLHMLKNPELLAVLPLLLERLPKGMSALLLSRFSPPLPACAPGPRRGVWRCLGPRICASPGTKPGPCSPRPVPSWRRKRWTRP